MKNKLRFNTITIHGGQSHDPAYGAVMPPIYQTSTYAQTTPGGHKGFEYSRTHNPTRQALEKSLASIENGKHGLAFGSGLAAIDAVLKLLEPGDEVISTNDLYGGSYRLFTKIFEGFGIKFHFVGMGDVNEITNAINKKTKLIWVETPTNPMMNVVDIKASRKKYKTRKKQVPYHNKCQKNSVCLKKANLLTNKNRLIFIQSVLLAVLISIGVET